MVRCLSSAVPHVLKKIRKKRKGGEYSRRNNKAMYQKKYLMKHSVVPADEYGFVGVFAMPADDLKLLSEVFSRNQKKLQPFLHNTDVKSVSKHFFSFFSY